MSIYLLAIDPGLHGCGVALFEGGNLSWAGYPRNSFNGRGPYAWRTMAHAVITALHGHTHFRRGLDMPTLALEIPRVYPGRQGKRTDPMDLLELAGVQGAISASFLGASIRAYFPADWKGQCDTEKVIVPRVNNALRPDEQNRIVSAGKSLDHNIYDAIGIGLHFLGRLHRRRGTGQE